MKTCTQCGIAKPNGEYFVKDKTTGRLHAQCKLCAKEYRKTYYSHHYAKYHEQYLKRAKLRRERLRWEFRNNMLTYMADKACVDCGENDIRVLELDHINPRKKLFSVSQAVSLGYAWDEVLSELQKCQVLCANCHKRRTAQQFRWYKAL